MTNLQNLQGLEGLQFSEELQYALECGVKFDITTLENGDVQVSWNNGQCVEILSFDTEVEEVEAKTYSTEEKNYNFEEMKVVVNNMDKIQKLSQCQLTDKELNVLEAIVNEQFEDGLPPFTKEVAERANLTEKQTVGVISSLYKKGFLEAYLDDESPNCQDMYHLTSEWFEKFNEIF